MKRFYSDLGLGLVALTVLAWASQAHADIANAGAPINKPKSCVAFWDWTLTAAPEAGRPNQCKPNWRIVPTSPAGKAGGPKELFFELQHKVRVPDHGAKENEPNPDKPVSIDAGAYKNGDFKAGAYVRKHPKLKQHDVYTWMVRIPAAGGAAKGDPEIIADALHVEEPFPAGWSYTVPKGVPTKIVSVMTSYPKTKDQKPALDVPKDKIYDKTKDVKAPGEDPGRLPDGKNGQKPSDYTVMVTIGDPFSSSMTLAYIVVDDSGGFTEADLATMNEFFVPGGEYFVPMLFDAHEIQDLFIGVDLVQWLSFPTSFSIGDIYSFTNGVSELLPGVFAATSPVSFDPVAGRFTSGDPLNGPGIALGTVDGGNVPVPEPSTSLLFGAGLLGLLYANWRRRKRVA